jgi:hypothetical protein
MPASAVYRAKLDRCAVFAGKMPVLHNFFAKLLILFVLILRVIQVKAVFHERQNENEKQRKQISR